MSRSKNSDRIAYASFFDANNNWTTLPSVGRKLFAWVSEQVAASPIMAELKACLI